MSQPASPLAEARQLFAEAGLPFPFIPPEMAGAIRRVSEWVYGTRTEAGNLYSIARFVQEAGTAPVADYLLFGHAGHGINSHAIHYYLVWGPLALFAQIGWGGAYMDQAQATQEVTARFAQAEALFHAVETARSRGSFQPGERLVVETSEFYGYRWRLLRGRRTRQVSLHPAIGARRQARYPCLRAWERG